MIKKAGTKRSGILLADVLIAIVIVFMIVSLAGVILFTYSVVASSADASRQFNMYSDDVDGVMLSHMLDPSLPDLGDLLVPNGVVISGNGRAVSAHIMQVTGEFKLGSRRIPIKIHMIQRP